MSLSCLEALWLRILNPPNTKTERADATAFVGGVLVPWRIAGSFLVIVMNWPWLIPWSYLVGR